MMHKPWVIDVQILLDLLSVRKAERVVFTDLDFGGNVILPMRPITVSVRHVIPFVLTHSIVRVLKGNY